MVNLADRLYAWFNRLMPFDIAVIYVLDLSRQSVISKEPTMGEKKPTMGEIEIRSLKEADLLQLLDPVMDFSDGEANRLWASCECIGAFSGDSLVGYAWHATGLIGAYLNTAGPPFKGCAMKLSKDTHYLFKVFVHPEHRGQGINVAMCERLSEDLEHQGCRQLITLTEWNNRAFRSSVEPMGFRAIGHCAEWVFANRSRYRLPDHLNHIARFTAA